MSKTLEQRLGDAKEVLDQVDAALRRRPTSMPIDVTDSFKKVVAFGAEIPHWIGLLKSREAAMGLLSRLENTVEEEDCVSLFSAPLKYQHVRFIGVQAYVTTTWALADRITRIVGHVLCTPEAGCNGAFPPQLVSHFVQKERAKKTAALFGSMKRTFGWPICVSYAIRNHFVHDGGRFSSFDLFEGLSPASAFRVSVEGWKRIEDTVSNTYHVDPSCQRAAGSWPTNPREDLRVVLSVCEREMDDALGILLGSACRSLLAHVGFMLGED
ncbi:MAG: hypothetical protein AB1486_05415 [Planctomycetota bacterium]